MSSLLRKIIESSGFPLSHMTVLEAHADPFRLDTPARHRDGRWLADAIADLIPEDRRLHLRGLHYLLVIAAIIRPDGSPYANNEETWLWLEKVAKAARWLGYVPFERFTDQRNAEPVIRRWQPPQHAARIRAGLPGFALPALGGLLPAPFVLSGEPAAVGFTGTQPYHLAAFGEKASLEPILGPLCSRYQADLYLPAGEISDTMLHQMAVSARDDGRPMVVLTFSDCDPSGWQMPISIARKLQGFRYIIDGLPGIRVYRVALVPRQVKKYDLPVSVLKENEKRKNAWMAATGTEQTEIDALAALRPDLLEHVGRSAFEQFFDTTLAQRADDAYSDWLEEARQMLADQAGEQAGAFADLAEEKLAAITEAVADINDAASALRELPLPDIEVPLAEAAPPPSGRNLLYDSSEDFVTATQRLLWDKSYGGHVPSLWRWGPGKRTSTRTDATGGDDE
jgi:hypothetical protein